MNINDTPHVGRVLELLSYDPQSGNLTWRHRRGGTASSGVVARGAITKCGYFRIKVDGKAIKAHDIAWSIAHGEWPPGQIEHINGNRTDNRLTNLRVVRAESVGSARVAPGCYVDANRVRELLLYDSDTGIFRWRRCPSGSLRANRVAGCPDDNGYCRIVIDGRAYFAHRLAWLCVHGEWPKEQIDHINGNPADNRIANLRDVSHATNQHNRKVAQRSSKTGVLGAHRVKNGYTASIKVNGVTHYLGYFRTADSAHQAYVDAKRRVHEGNTL